ncbi:CocE/NonD family hydrolase [Marinobacter salexigens]|uniref:CocE/NonD family hydrolase n=1 Tax=Marinobacter salexigens TaxID=1925763 RepID=UPI000C288393|nr:CocE/NonD family hydrolase [Marinobacter salexigens]
MGVFDVDYSKIRERTDLPYSVKVTEHTPIPLSDGTVLSAKLWLPEGLAKARGVVLEYLPYRKDEFTALRDEIRHGYFAGCGYAAIRVDIRGTGDSSGIIQDEYPVQEQEDCLEVFDWIAAQEWSAGNVAMIGKSWGGFNGLQMAVRNHPALKTIISLCSTDDRYADDVHYRGGTLMGSDMLWWASTMFAYNARPPFPRFVGDQWRDMWLERMEKTPPFVETWLEHQQRDVYWEQGSVCEDYSAIRIPVLTMSGWADGYTDAVFRLMDNLDVPKRAIIGPWAHEFPDLAIPGPQIGYLQECISWFDRWLATDATSEPHEDSFIVYLQDSVAPQTSYDYREGQWVDLLATDISSVDVMESLSGQQTLINRQHHGMYSGVFCPFGQEGDLPDDQTIDNALAATWTLPVADEPLNLLGNPRVNLWLKSDQPTGNVHARLTDVSPTGEKTYITAGQFNLTHRHSHASPEALPVDEWFDVSFRLDAIGYQLPAGHRLEISLSPTYWPQIWPSVSLARLEVDLDRSQILVPQCAEPVLTELPFTQAETAKPLEKTILREGSRTRQVIKSLTTHEWVLDDFSDEGLRMLDHNGITYGTKNHNIWRIQENDPLSAVTESNWEVDLSDADISIHVETQSRLSCDADNFYLVNSMQAYEEGKEVFRNTWEKTIPRRFC